MTLNSIILEDLLFCISHDLKEWFHALKWLLKGLNDILNVKFKEFSPGTQVYFAVGKTFPSATGELIEDLQGKLLRVGFPNQIFMTVIHRPE